MTKSERIEDLNRSLRYLNVEIKRLGDRVRALEANTPIDRVDALEARVAFIEAASATHVLATAPDAAPTSPGTGESTVAPDTLPPIKVGDRVRVLHVQGYDDAAVGAPYVGAVLRLASVNSFVVAGNPTARRLGNTVKGGVGWYVFDGDYERISPLWREPEPPKCDGCDSLRSELAAERKAHGETKGMLQTVRSTLTELQDLLVRGMELDDLRCLTANLQRIEGRLRAEREAW